jgi:hypothetical protein
LSGCDGVALDRQRRADVAQTDVVRQAGSPKHVERCGCTLDTSLDVYNQRIQTGIVRHTAINPVIL